MMRRILALDVGTVRIGVAVSDPLGAFAQGIAVLQAKGQWMDELAQLIEEYGAKTILVGMPRRTDGSTGPEAENMEKTIARLRERFPDIGIEVWDERFTTTIAQQALLEADVSRKGRKERVDKVAATLLLQNYLDSLNVPNSRDGAEAEISAPSMPLLPEDNRKKGGKRRDRAYE